MSDFTTTYSTFIPEIVRKKLRNDAMREQKLGGRNFSTR